MTDINATPDRQLAKIIADSVSPHGVRLTTIEIEIPRIVLAEFNTHRALSRNSASSRAIPVEKMLHRVEEDPYIPEQWDRNGAGMQGHGPLDAALAREADEFWQRACDDAVGHAQELLALGVHKQWANRPLEPFMWHTIVVTATEWSNFFHLRNHPLAHPAIARTAAAMQATMEASTPTRLEFGQWHLPFVDERDKDLRMADKIKVSTARCARVSYLTHDGIRDPQADIDLHDRLLASGHMSPLEHAARPMTRDDVVYSWNRTQGLTGFDRSQIDMTEHFSGNFRGWTQYRKTIKGEADILAHRSNDAC
jgi:thymidylate synthase ThyX